MHTTPLLQRLLLLILITVLANACGKRTFYHSIVCEKNSDNVLAIDFKSKRGSMRALEIDTSRKMILLTESTTDKTQWAVEFKQVKQFEVNESGIFSVELKNGDNFNFGTVESSCLDQIKTHLGSILPVVSH